MAELIPTSPVIPAGALTTAYAELPKRRITPYESQRAYGEALLAEATKQRPLRSPITGIAEALKAGLGGWISGQADRRQLARERATTQAIGKMLSAPPGSDMGKIIAEAGDVDPEMMAPIMGAVLQQRMAMQNQNTLYGGGYNAIRPGGGGGGGGGSGGPVAAVHANAEKVLGFPLPITSADRTAAHNAEVGGAIGSQHLTPDAALDISLAGLTDEQKTKVYNHFLSDPRVGGIGFYADHLHIDTRGGQRATWGTPPAAVADQVKTWQASAPPTVQAGGGGGGGATAGTGFDAGADLERQAAAAHAAGNEPLAYQLQTQANAARTAQQTQQAQTAQSQGFQAGQTQKAQEIQQQQNREAKALELVQNYRGTKEYQDYQQSVVPFRAGVAAASNPNFDLAAQNQLKNAYLQIMDPGAKLRGDNKIEFTRGAPAYIQDQVSKYLTGSPTLEPQQRQEMIDQMRIRMREQHAALDKTRQNFAANAQQQQLNPVLPELDLKPEELTDKPVVPGYVPPKPPGQGRQAIDTAPQPAPAPAAPPVIVPVAPPGAAVPVPPPAVAPPPPAVGPAIPPPVAPAPGAPLAMTPSGTTMAPSIPPPPSMAPGGPPPAVAPAIPPPVPVPVPSPGATPPPLGVTPPPLGVTPPPLGPVAPPIAAVPPPPPPDVHFEIRDGKLVPVSPPPEQGQ